jgi:hypothetical protein
MAHNVALSATVQKGSEAHSACYPMGTGTAFQECVRSMKLSIHLYTPQRSRMYLNGVIFGHRGNIKSQETYI